ncbi:MAG: hypothetical protein IKL40_05650 [Clostridia bacterium]|nr:hypothetical protein [Clostridia bacterium]
MGLFNNTGRPNGSEKEILESKYQNSLYNILLVVGLTAVNLFLLITNSNTYFLFSAYIPFILTDFGMFFSGMYPSEYYAEYFPDMVFSSQSFFVIMLVISIVILALYVLSWIFARKRKIGWLIFALVFFSVDTAALFLFNGLVAESIIDYAIHAWVIVSLANGISAFNKLKKLPADAPTLLTVESDASEVTSEETSVENTINENVSPENEQQ